MTCDEMRSIFDASDVASLFDLFDTISEEALTCARINNGHAVSLRDRDILGNDPF